MSRFKGGAGRAENLEEPWSIAPLPGPVDLLAISNDFEE